MATIQYPSQQNLCIDSGDRFRASDVPDTTFFNTRQPSYNDFTIVKNQNLIQGQFARLLLSEIRFPWAVPNIAPPCNTMLCSIDGTNFSRITIQPGFYSGTSLATAISAEIQALGGGFSTILCTYLSDRQAFEFSAPGLVELTLTSAIGIGPGDLETSANTPSLLNVIGMNPKQFLAFCTDLSNVNPDGTIGLVGGYASLLYTSYIDIVSEQLTNYQTARDMTTQIAPKQSVICRLFISDETSNNVGGVTGSVLGTAPFVIHRQFKNPKVFNWDSDRSVGVIDIALYDQYGKLLYIPSQSIFQFGQEVVVRQPMPDFQITFMCSEDTNDRDKAFVYR